MLKSVLKVNTQNLKIRKKNFQRFNKGVMGWIKKMDKGTLIFYGQQNISEGITYMSQNTIYQCFMFYFTFLGFFII